MRRRGVKVEVILLDVFTVIPFVAGQAKEPLLENGVAAVPESDSEADGLMAVADAANTVFAPAIRFRARMIVREVVLRIAVRAIVLAHRAPGPLAEVWAPPFPVGAAMLRLFEPPLLMGE